MLNSLEFKTNYFPLKIVRKNYSLLLNKKYKLFDRF